MDSPWAHLCGRCVPYEASLCLPPLATYLGLALAVGVFHRDDHPGLGRDEIHRTAHPDETAS